MKKTMTKPNLTERTVKTILNMIVENKMQSGESFFTEAELEKKIHVSRQIIREAVSRLKALGFLKSRQSIGLVIDKPDPIGLFEGALDHYMMDTNDIHELGEFRYALEVGTVELAVRRASSGQLDNIKIFAQECNRLMQGGDYIEAAKADLDFHIEILKAANNQFLTRMSRVLMTFFSKRAQENSPYVLFKHPNDLTKQEHQAIVSAFEQRNMEKARFFLSEHLFFLLKEGKQAEN
ncbi:MAG: FadR family transcriptional regulator [Spirochaetales bacterium]|nr:FadR family transcriptional regulator [Spirochaetales bacterium]